MADERTTREHEQLDPDAGLGKQARALKEDLKPERLEERIEEAMRENPLLEHVLDLRVVARALALAAVGAIVLWLLAGSVAAALGLVVLFFGGWLLLATIQHDRRQPTRAAERDA